MKLNDSKSASEIDFFNTFRELYNTYSKRHEDCEIAFKKANEDFFCSFGTHLFKNLDDYILELFKTHNGFQIF